MNQTELNKLYINLIESYFAGSANREMIAAEITNLVEVDNEGAKNELLSNCEQSIRHINEKDYYTTDKELKFLLSCLKGEIEFNEKSLAHAINT